VEEHYNLYYLLLEDKEKHPLPAQQSERIQKNIEKFCKEIKPFRKSLPLTNRGRKLKQYFNRKEE